MVGSPGSCDLMNKPKAAFLGNLSSLKEVYPEFLRLELAQHADLYAEDLDASSLPSHAKGLASTEILFGTWGVPALTPELLNLLPSLRFVYYAAGSIKSFATAEAYARGIRFFSSWEANAIPVSEFTLGAILLSMKKVWQNAAGVREAKSFRRVENMPGMYGSKVGLVSLGAIGKRVAEKLRDFEVDVLAYDPFFAPEQAAALGVRLLSLEEVFASCDIISIHTPWIPETVGMINASLLRSMQPGATLINTSRGAVVEEPALCTILEERPDLFAVLDVTYPEPPAADSPLYRLPNVLLTPHIAGSMDAEVVRMGRWMVDEFLRIQRGESPKHHVSQDTLSRMA